MYSNIKVLMESVIASNVITNTNSNMFHSTFNSNNNMTETKQ